MAAIAATSASVVGLPSLRVQHNGLRMANKIEAVRGSSFHSLTKHAVSSSRTTCAVDAFPIISASTASLLALGRFVFLPYHRSSLKAAGLPTQNGVPHAEAGDSRAIEVVGVLKTNDPEGFTIVDVLAWGALGHAIGFFFLAVLNNDYNPTF